MPAGCPTIRLRFCPTENLPLPIAGHRPHRFSTAAIATAVNVQRLSANYLNDFTPSVMEDGRIVYSRWEYVDRPAIPIQSLWTINPDGTGLGGLFGNRVLSPATFMEAHEFPGTGQTALRTDLAQRPLPRCDRHHRSGSGRQRAGGHPQPDAGSQRGTGRQGRWQSHPRTLREPFSD